MVRACQGREEGPINYRLRWLTDKMKVDNVNVVDMKPFYGPDKSEMLMCGNCGD